MMQVFQGESTMRVPQLLTDGWFLEDGEERNLVSPMTFQIPDLEVRKILQPGDWAKVMFAVAIKGEEFPTVERMWVIVRERLAGGYLGILDNEPSSDDVNGRLRRGMELPFEPRHIIDVQHGNPQSRVIAFEAPTIPWR